MNPDLTEQERHLIGCLREQPEAQAFSIEISVEDGAWEIKMRSGKFEGRGVGTNFAAAWDGITGLQFDRGA